MREMFVDQRIYSKGRAVLAKAEEICAGLKADGYEISLRQLYYQLVSRGIIANRAEEYGNLGNLIANARLAGLFDWDYIVDRNRRLEPVPHWSDPSSIIRAAAESYRLDKWIDQDFRVEVWVEKDALSGVVARPAHELDTPYFACKGYVSISEMYVAAKRHIGYEDSGQETIVLHFGDHDPSGIDMTRDIQERLAILGSSARVERVALTMEQIDRLKPPPNPVKASTVTKAYIEEFGVECWELDALPPRELSDLVRTSIEGYMAPGRYRVLSKEEAAQREALAATSLGWNRVESFVEDRFGQSDRERIAELEREIASIDELADLAENTADTTRAKALREAVLRAAGRL